MQIYNISILGYKEWRATNNKKGASKTWNIQDAIEPQTGKFRVKVLYVGCLISRNALSKFIFFSKFDSSFILGSSDGEEAQSEDESTSATDEPEEEEQDEV